MPMVPTCFYSQVIWKKKKWVTLIFLKRKNPKLKGGGNTDNVAYKPQRVIKTDNIRRRSTKPRFAVGIWKGEENPRNH